MFGQVTELSGLMVPSSSRKQQVFMGREDLGGNKQGAARCFFQQGAFSPDGLVHLCVQRYLPDPGVLVLTCSVPQAGMSFCTNLFERRLFKIASKITMLPTPSQKHASVWTHQLRCCSGIGMKAFGGSGTDALCLFWRHRRDCREIWADFVPFKCNCSVSSPR